jgi:hypothetical protein
MYVSNLSRVQLSTVSVVDIIILALIYTLSIMRLAARSFLMCSVVTYALSPACSSSSSAARRSFLATTTLGIWGTVGGIVPAANALQERNDALCGTGFYTNIWQYKCTVVGDIEDEGIPKDLSAEDQGTVDSLMSKLNIESDSTRTSPAGEPSVNDPKGSAQQH